MNPRPTPARKHRRDTLQQEALRLQYQVRSAFFFEKVQAFQALPQAVDSMRGVRLSWRRREQIGISQPAWELASKNGWAPHKVFCHPELIRGRPSIIAYYRTLAVLPQKGVQKLAFATASLEEGKQATLTSDRAESLALLFNSHICAALDANPSLSLEDLRLAGAMNYGTQLNGSWRNEIDAQASRRINTMLLRNFDHEHLVASITLKDGQRTGLPFDQLNVEQIRAMELTNGYTLLFGSEPDISILPPSGPIAGAVEIKAALDEAGALERLGAALKSFSNVRSQNKSALTVYLTSCITPTVRRRIRNQALISKDFNLTRVLAGRNDERELKTYLKWVAHLPT